MSKSNKGRLLKWFSLPVCVLVLFAAYFNYNVINHDEDLYVHNTTKHVTEVVRSEIQRVIQLPLVGLEQMGQRWISDNGWNYKDWVSRSQDFLNLVHPVQSIEWIGPNEEIQWVTPYKPNAFLIHTRLNKFPDTVRVLRQVEKNHALLLTPVVSLIEGGQGFLAIKGVSDKKNGTSYIAAVFNADKLFQPLLRQSLFQGYFFTIRQNGLMLYQRGEGVSSAASPFAKTLTVHIKNVNWELMVWPSSGEIRLMKSSAPQIILVSGVIIALILAIAFYIAGQKIHLSEESIRAAREIAEATKKNHLILEKANEGFVSVDIQGKILNWNLYAEKIFGWLKEEVIGQRFQDFVVPAYDRDLVIKRIKTFIDSKKKGITDKKLEIMAVNKDGHELPIEMTVFTIRSEDANTYHAFVRDITERKLVEKMKNEFISVVSHELRTPLTAIKGSISLLVDSMTVDLSEKSKKLLTIAQKNCDRLILLINDILDIEKIESGKFELRNKQFRIMVLVQEAIRANETYASKYNVKLVINSSCDVLIYADYDRLMQVLTNLLSNAVKFSKPGSQVTLHVYKKVSRVVFAVQDTGEGIPEEFHHKIFTKFAQADSSSARGKGGTGLGLSICKAIVEMHHGQINFESREGEGTTFFVSLPIIANDDQIKNEILVKKVCDKKNQGKINILHIEDDPDVLKITQMLLEHEANVIPAKSLYEARNMLNKRNYDLVILDFSLPDGHGGSLLPIVNLETKHLTPVIVFSSYELAGNLSQYVSAGLIKSLTSNDLLVGTVRALVHHNNVFQCKENHEKA